MVKNGDRILSWMLGVAALFMAVSVAHSSFFAKPTPRRAARGPTEFPQWERSFAVGTRTGNSNAPVTIVAFADFECPGCRRFHSVVKQVKLDFPDAISFVHVHYPLSMHRFAIPAARAAECAKKEGLFAEIADVMYAKQDSFGLKTWSSYAAEAGVKDTAALQKCATNTAPVAAIEDGRNLALEWEFTATPTIIINGYRYERMPTPDDYRRIVSRILEGGNPFTEPSSAPGSGGRASSASQKR